MHEEFQNGDIGTAGSLHRLLRGLASQRALKRDEFITPELTNHLFQTPGFPFGLDLAAINIQRGRDHGLAPYTAWRVPCGLSPIQSWDEFGNVVPHCVVQPIYTSFLFPISVIANVVGPESAKRIGHAYRSVHDIDLFVGGIAERPVVGGLVGPTFACIIAQQFSNSRRGDRFWYENGGFESSFTPAQLHSLRRVSLAQVLCRAVGGGTFQPHIFIPAEFTDNERQNCGTGILGFIDLSPWLEQDPFLPAKSQPEHVFNIVQSELSQDEIGVVPIVKEDKAGFSNRVKPMPHVSLSPNSATGFLRPTNANISKINDKLDLKRKTLTVTKTKTSNNSNRNVTPTRGVNNKLDKSPKITINIKNVSIRKPGLTSPKRTVIINNVPIELRSAGDDNITSSTKTDHELPSNTETELQLNDTELPELRHIDSVQGTDLHSDSAMLTDRSETTTETSLGSHLQDDALDPLRQNSADLSNIKRVQREVAKPNITDVVTETKLLHGQRNRTTTHTTTTKEISKTTAGIARSRTTKSSKISKTTKRGVELRSHYQSRPVYPQKVVVNGPNSNDQYEIEINIRQTNKSPVTRPLTAEYTDYTTSTIYRPYSNYENSYAPQFMDYGSTTPSYGYYPTHRDSIPQLQKTKPPTIIYLNDNDDRRTTTRAPNIFQNFLSFATNTFNPNANRRPTQAPSPLSSIHQERPYQETHVINSPISSSHTITSSAQYAPRPPQSHSISSSSQIGGNPQSNYLHASSSAVSSGNYGSISGVASANGADSIFSFNIRPRPDNNPVFSSYPRPQNLGGSYGLVSQSPYKPDYQQSQSELYYDRELNQNPSPFSTGSLVGHRPLTQTQTYYARTPELKQLGSNINEISNTDHKLDNFKDYDFLSRTLSNVTADDLTPDSTDDYTYDDDEQSKNIDFTKVGKPIDNRTASHDNTHINLLVDNKILKNSTTTASNTTYLNDNFVLPMLENTTQTSYVTEMPKPMLSTSSRSITNSKITVFSDSVGKQLGSNILADADDYDERSAVASAAVQQLTNVAFAPINVLTKPDR